MSHYFDFLASIVTDCRLSLQYMLNIVANNSFKIATDKSGCCVIQQCVDYAEGETKEHLMAQIILNASLLAEDCYGFVLFFFLIIFFIHIVPFSNK